MELSVESSQSVITVDSARRCSNSKRFLCGGGLVSPCFHIRYSFPVTVVKVSPAVPAHPSHMMLIDADEATPSRLLPLLHYEDEATPSRLLPLLHYEDEATPSRLLPLLHVDAQGSA